MVHGEEMPKAEAPKAHGDAMPKAQQDRSTALAVMLGLVMGLGFLGFFWLIAPDFFIICVVVIGGISLYAGLHYLLWGKAMMQETAAERATLAAEAKAEAAKRAAHLPHDRRY